MESESKRIKRTGKEAELIMASHTMETALLVLAFVFACMAVVVAQAIITICHMSLTLQEQVMVRGTPIVIQVKFSKCHRE